MEEVVFMARGEGGEGFLWREVSELVVVQG